MTVARFCDPALGRSLPLLVWLGLGAIGCTPAAGKVPAASPVGVSRAASAPEELPETRLVAPHFVLDGKPFCFAGTNNYYLAFESAEAAANALNAAHELHLPVIRTWAFFDRGSLDGAVPSIHPGSADKGVYFQYWDRDKNAPAYNDGPSGLERLDFVLHHARQRGQKLILVLTNSWRDYGGMDQYLMWFGLSAHHMFFTDQKVKNAYKDYVAHLLTRINSLDGVPYRDDPAIFAWELANEPRTLTLTLLDSPTGWDKTTLVTWASEMSSFIHELDPNHMVAVGDEGFLPSGGTEWPYGAPFGVDSEALTRLPSVDFGTFHLYPDHWALSDEWGGPWIDAHIDLARTVDKPILLEEYGVRVRRASETSGEVVDGLERRNRTYAAWNERILRRGGAGALFWMLGAETRPGALYPDYDRFTLYPGEPSADLLGGLAANMNSSARACTLVGSKPGVRSGFVQAHGVRGAASP